MKKPVKNSFSPIILISALTLAGCSNLLYSDARAPVYSNTQAKRGGVSTEPAVFNSSLTPVPSASTVTTPSIERPSGLSVQNSNNPYATSGTVKITPISRAPVAANTITRPSSVATPAQSIGNQVVKPAATVNNGVQAVNNATMQASQTIHSAVNQPVQSIEKTVDNTMSASAKAAASTDSRIKEATSVLNQPTQGVQETVVEKVSRPSAVANSTTEQVTAPVQKVASQVNNAAESVNKTTENAVAATKATQEKVEKAVEKTQKTVAAKTPTATTALLQEARGAVASGNYDKAASALERAHRIEPGNAKILYDIAQIRYAQGKYRQAESFASKAATLSNSSNLSKKTWSLLSNSRKALGNTIGAETAAKKAASF